MSYGRTLERAGTHEEANAWVVGYQWEQRISSTSGVVAGVGRRECSQRQKVPKSPQLREANVLNESEAAPPDGPVVTILQCRPEPRRDRIGQDTIKTRLELRPQFRACVLIFHNHSPLSDVI